MSDEELIDSLMSSEIVGSQVFAKEEGGEEWVPEKPDYFHIEMTRRLIKQLKSFNKTTNIFSGVLIFLVIVQIVLAILWHKG